MEQRTVSGRWNTLMNVFRPTGSSSKTFEGGEPSAKDADRRRPNDDWTPTAGQREDGRHEDGRDDDGRDDDGRDDDRDGGEDGDSTASRVRMAELKLDIVNVLYAESKRKNERAVAWLSDAKHENCRLSVVVCELEAKLYELARRVAAVERRAERRADAAGRRADRAERRAERAERRAAQVAGEAAERRSALSRAVADLQGVLSSRVADLRIDALRTAVEKIEDGLGATVDVGTGKTEDDPETQEDERDP